MGGLDRGCRKAKRKYTGIREEPTFIFFHHLTDSLTDNAHNQDHDLFVKRCLVFSPIVTNK